MTLLFVDGFDHVDDGFELLKWDAYATEFGIAYASTYGLDGGWGIRFDSNASYYLQKNLAANESTVIVGGYFKVDTLNSSNEFLNFLDSGTSQVEVRAMSDGSIAVYRGTTLLAQSSIGLVSAVAWFNLGVKVTFSQTVGQITVKLGPTTIINTAANLDTCASANEYANNVRIYSNGGFTYVDHFYLANTTAGKVADIVQGLKIATLYPDADGAVVQFTPSSGSNYQTIDEQQLTGTTDYNSSSTVGHKDRFSMGTFSGLGAIYGVQIVGAVSNPDAGTVVMRSLVYSGTVPAEVEGSDFTTTATPKAMMTVHEQEPTDTVDWTASKVNAAEFGYKFQSAT